MLCCQSVLQSYTTAPVSYCIRHHSFSCFTSPDSNLPDCFFCRYIANYRGLIGPSYPSSFRCSACLFQQLQLFRLRSRIRGNDGCSTLVSPRASGVAASCARRGREKFSLPPLLWLNGSCLVGNSACRSLWRERGRY
jgi:hypothetical protein